MPRVKKRLPLGRRAPGCAYRCRRRSRYSQSRVGCIHFADVTFDVEHGDEFIVSNANGRLTHSDATEGRFGSVLPYDPQLPVQGRGSVGWDPV